MKLKGLLLNDFYTLKEQYFSYMKVMIPCFILLGIVHSDTHVTTLSDFSYFIIMLLVFPMNVMMSLFTYEEKSGYMKYAFTMPITRKTYIQEKYLFHILNTVGAVLIGDILILAFALINGYLPNAHDVIWLICYSGVEFLVSMIFGTWVISLNMKFNISKARIIMVMGMAFVMITVIVISSGFLSAMTDSSLNSFALWVSVSIGGVLLLLTIWMFFMSFRWTERKEL
ncbi:MAG: ABC-2 transporter permease [Oscillospiraceae bacterium]|nr:ABC-2 transporter permease [Oscillospiraceae bacterium]